MIEILEILQSIAQNSVWSILLGGLFWIIMQVVLIIQKNRPFVSLHQLGSFVFVFFLIITFEITGIPLISEITLRPEINLIPFLDILSDYKQYLANVLLFVPLGFFFSLSWKENKSLLRTILFGFLLSLTIECLQIFSLSGITDINDVMTNTLGTLIGYGIFRILNHFAPNFVQLFHLKTESQSVLIRQESLISSAFSLIASIVI
ncbi:MAG: VanZ family protein [Clostridiales bacterium]|nr:VanZ family protein [Clostridiales bacterium]